MKHLLVSLLAAVFGLSIQTARAGDDWTRHSPAKLKAGIESKHPAAYYALATKLFADAKTKDEAVFWFYLGQLRFRYHLAANPDLPRSGDPALFASLSEVVGRPINEYAGGKPKLWVVAINRALTWDKDHANEFTPKTKHPAQYASIRKGLVKMRDYVSANEAAIRKARKENGLD